MKPVVSRLAALALGVSLASCGGGASPAAPSAPSLPAAPPALEIALETSASLAPAGFRYAQHVDPKAGEDGVVRGESPLTVTIDLCGSTPTSGKTLHFLFDWEGDGHADVVGTGDDCRQTHTYRMPNDAIRDVVVGTDVCVTNGDPSVRDGSTYFSCRTVRVGLPNPGVCGAAINTPYGCVTYDGGSFVWPGGSGPVRHLAYWETPGCEGEPDGVTTSERYVVACDDAEARRLCADTTTTVGDQPISVHGLTLYLCGEPIK